MNETEKRRIINVGFIGAGDISVLHAEAIRNISGANLAGLWNITEDLAQEKSKLFGCKIYPSAHALVSDPAIDAVFILTSLEAHHEYAMLAIKAGKHVYVEKPVGASVEEITQMKMAAEEGGVICMPGHNYIHEDGLRRTKDLIASGRLGKIASIYILYNIAHPEEVAARFPGVVKQILSHHAYIALFLAGAPDKLSAMKSVIHYEEITQEDLALVNMKMKNGAIAHLCASFAADDHAGDPWTVLIKVIGTKGATRYSYRDWVENTPAQVHSQTYSAFPYTIENSDTYFIDECVRKGTQPPSTMDDAIMVQKILEAVEQSIDEERHIYL